ncbi:uncharacterized protein LOC114849245 isoform X2 [Betta splendens]|uniref:Uncharacterized protein LOC114849245 isoform X2 n=1 Tax=Betta splendens TaxID=158456 RepID=A0A8M1HAA8_BETSP|nr:uncharacterized protein LOC114849245 isoform X2 [Betta splendens]
MQTGGVLLHRNIVYLSVLTISPAPPDADPKSDGNVTLLCTLFRSSTSGLCEQNSFRWLDETGAELQELRQTNCVSALSVKRQRGPNRRFRCQYVEDQSVRIEVHYPPVSTEPDAEKIYIGSGVGVGLVVLLILTAVLIKRRKKAKVTEDLHQPADALEAQSGVTYCTVSHHKAEVAQRQAKDHDAVTYSEIRAATADTNDDATHLYSCVIKTQ